MQCLLRAGAINSPQAERHPSSGLAVPTSCRKGGGVDMGP